MKQINIIAGLGIILTLMVLVSFMHSGGVFQSDRVSDQVSQSDGVSQSNQVPRTVVKTPEPKASTCNQRFVFIDLGANRADTARIFLKRPNVKFEYDFPKPEGCDYKDAELYLFEANPLFNKDLVQGKEEIMKNKLAKSVTLFPSTAVWIQDSIMKFYVDTVNTEKDFWGSSMFLMNSYDVSANVYVNISTIDIAKFILVNFLPSDFVVVKMDIEGAEYGVFPHIYNMGAYINIDHMLIEWHGVPPNMENRDKVKKENDEVFQKMLKAGVALPAYDSGA